MSEPSGARRAMYLVTGASILVPVVGVFTAPILSHTLGVSGRGEVATALAPYSLMVSVATLGLPEAMTFEIAKRPDITRRALWFSSLVTLTAGALCFALAVFSASALTDGDPRLSSLLVLATTFAVPALVLNVVRGAATGLHMWRAIAVERVVNALLRLVILGGLALAHQLTVELTIVVTGTTPLIAGLAYWRLLTLRGRAALVPPADDVPVPRPVGRPLMAYGSRVWLGAVASMLNGRLSQLVITPLSDVKQLGLFVIAITVSDVPLILSGAVRDVVFGLNAREADIEQLTAVSRLITIIMGIVSLAIAAILPWSIGPFFGQGFDDALAPTLLLLAAGWLGMPGLIAGTGLGAWGRPGLRSGIVIVALVVNGGGLALLVPHLGALGAGYAGLLSSGVSSLFAVLAMSRVAQVNPLDFVLPRRVDVVRLGQETQRLLRYGRRLAVLAR